MSDSIKELIVKNAIVALEAITIANNYANTIASVQRPLQQGQSYINLPMLYVVQGDDDRIAIEDPYIRKKFTLAVVAMTRIDIATDTRSIDEVCNSLAADIEKTLTANPAISSRGGYAIDTIFLSSGEYIPAEGQPEVGIGLFFEITYQHRIGDPYNK